MLEEQRQKVAAIITSAGFGRRMGREIPKQFLEIRGKPLFVYTLEKFDLCSSVDEVILVVPDGTVEKTRKIVARWNIRKIDQVITGGAKRQDSVTKGLEVVPDGIDILLIHDAVRPFVSVGKIDEVIRAARNCGAAILAVSEKNTVKRVKEGWVEETLNRKVLWRVQTPQGFRFDWIREGYVRAKDEGYYATDDAALVERLGRRVQIVEGEEKNIKITSPFDLLLAELILDENKG